MGIIAFQPELRPALPYVFVSKEYREFRATLIEMDRILSVLGMEQGFIVRQIKKLEEREGRRLSSRRAQRHGRTFQLALRYGILLGITSASYRKLSDSLLEWFEKFFPADELATLIHELTGATADQTLANELL